MIYAKAAIENGWSRSVLEFQIETKYHLRNDKFDADFMF